MASLFTRYMTHCKLQKNGEDRPFPKQGVICKYTHASSHPITKLCRFGQRRVFTWGLSSINLFNMHILRVAFIIAAAEAANKLRKTA